MKKRVLMRDADGHCGDRRICNDGMVAVGPGP